jgi:NTE family protein
MPLVFEPVKFNSMILVDGGLTEVIPAKTVRDMGATKVVGVNLNSSSFPQSLNIKDLTLLKVANQSMSVVLREIAERDSQFTDVCINMPIKSIPLSAFADDPTPFIEMGATETRKKIPEIKLL